MQLKEQKIETVIYQNYIDEILDLIFTIGTIDSNEAKAAARILSKALTEIKRIS